MCLPLHHVLGPRLFQTLCERLKCDFVLDPLLYADCKTFREDAIYSSE
jgi:hypothetical protein